MAGDVEDILKDLIARVDKVRLWLIALGVLRTAALGLACVSVYVGLYSWIDHRVHFGRLARLSALALLVALLAFLAYYLITALQRSMTYSRAASYIENKRSFDQQLVAAVEYYERRPNYPYSAALARQLVIQVDDAARGFRFDSTVDKRRGYLLATFVLLCVAGIGVFVQQNVLYCSSYLARLVRPFSQAKPVPATVLESITGDVVTGPNVPVVLSSAVRGRTLALAALVVTPQEHEKAGAVLLVSAQRQAGAGQGQADRTEIRPKTDAEGDTVLTATKYFDTLGRFTYRFEAGDAQSDSHTVTVCEPPGIKSITATVSLPDSNDPKSAGTYTQEVTNRTLEVLPRSRVDVNVQTTVPLRDATIIGPDQQSATKSLNGAEAFTFQFAADKDSSIDLELVSAEGLSNSEPLNLQVVLKSDESPQFRLLSPEGDYLTTDVASVPIAFEVSDDFGIDSAQLCCEFPNQEPVVLDSVVPQGSKGIRLSHTLELEGYDLEVGDGILFYARAKDVNTGPEEVGTDYCSDIYFIEIRPYRQYWHPQAGGTGNCPGAPAADDLVAILEYTRAILKKTWAIAQMPQLAAGDRAKLDAISADVQYCAEQLAAIRDDPESGFDESGKSALNEVLAHYNEADRCLARHDAGGALPPETNAYRLLRKFIDELHLKWKPPQSGQSQPQQKPERIKLQEQPESPQVEKERVESQLDKLQKEIEQLTQEQKSLKADLNETLQQRSQAAKTAAPSSAQADSAQLASNASRAKSSQKGEDSQKTSDGRRSTGQQSQSQDGSDTGRGASSTDTSGGRGQGQSSSSAEGSDQGSSAHMDVRLRMLQARQRALRERTSELQADLQQLPLGDHPSHADARDKAGQRLNEAIETMDELEDKLADTRYKPELSFSDEMKTSDLADAAVRRLAEAEQAIMHGLSTDEARRAGADKAEELAAQLAKDADALDESVSAAEREQMLKRLETAKRLLESMGEPQWATVSGGASGQVSVYTKNPNTGPAETARMLARRFWSIALETRERPVQPVEQEPSDVEFFEPENEFFQEAAKFRPKHRQK
jgi:hypothetical protein